MERKPKEFYESPLTTVVEVEQEGVVCASPKFNKPFSDEEDW